MSPYYSSTRQQNSTRDARGEGWHKKGYRDHGSMWLNVRRSSGPTREINVNENITLARLWNSVLRSVQMENGFPVPEDWTFGLFSNRVAIPLTEDPVRSVFDGGETIYVKIYDENARERVYDFETGVWEYMHVPLRSN